MPRGGCLLTPREGNKRKKRTGKTEKSKGVILKVYKQAASLHRLQEGVVAEEERCQKNSTVSCKKKTEKDEISGCAFTSIKMIFSKYTIAVILTQIQNEW